MSSASKTEKPTQERLKKEGKKGRSFQSKDLMAAAVLAVGTTAMANMVSLQKVTALYPQFIQAGFRMPLRVAVERTAIAMGWAVLPLLVVAVIAIVLVSIAMSRGRLAPEALRIDLNRVNPVNGAKNLFSMKVVKDLLRSLLYLLVSTLYAGVALRTWGGDLIALVHASPSQVMAQWLSVATKFTLGLLAALAPVYLLTGWLDHVLFIREMKMDKDEVKRERKDQEMKPELRRRRSEIVAELPAQVQADTTGSTLVLANPTHIAVGIYLYDENLAMPFVSVRESGRRARQVIALAEASGVPVVRDVRLARSIYASTRRYRFVANKDIDAVMDLVRWIHDVERARLDDAARPPADDSPGLN